MPKYAVSYWEFKTIIMEEPSLDIVTEKSRHSIAMSKGKLLLSSIEPIVEGEDYCV